MSRSSTSLLALLMSMSIVSVAFADADSDYRWHDENARALVRAGELRKAIREWEMAYAAAPKPEALFDIGLAYYKLAPTSDASIEDTKRAIDSFAQYLDRYRALHGGDPDDLKTVERYLGELRARLPQAPPAPPPSEAPTASPAPPLQPAPAPTTTTAEPERPLPIVTTPIAETAPTPIDKPHSNHRRLGIAIAAAGAAVLVAGAALTAIGYSKSDADKSSTLDDYLGGISTLNNERGAGITLLAAGALATVAGALVATLPSRGERRVACWFAPSLNGLVAGGTV